jgi:predicted dehydrogenase
MARSATECDAMNRAFAQAGLPLFVAFYRRALPRFLKVRELVEAGRIGTVTGVTYRFAGDSHRRMDRDNLPWRWIAEEAGGGQFLDLGCHTLDVLDFMLGPLEEPAGRAANVASPCDVEDSVTLQFRLASGALGTAAWNFASDRREDLIEIAGTDGEIALSTFGNEPVRLKRGDTVELIDLPNPKHIQQPFIATIVAHLNGKGECASTGATAVRTARVMDAALDAYYGGRSDAFWERPETWPGRRDGVNQPISSAVN